MGGAVVSHIVEQGAKESLEQWVKGWFTHSGEAQLKSLGEKGIYTADLLKRFEQFQKSNMSYTRNEFEKVFKSVPQQHHQDLENAVLGKPHNLPGTFAPQAQRLTQLKDVIERKAQQSGQAVVIRGRRVPLVMHPEGPYVHHPDVLKPNTLVRKAALQEVMAKHGVSQNEAAKVVEATVRPQNGRNAVSHVSWPQNRIEAGRLPVDQRWQQWGTKAADKISQNVFFGAHDQNLQAIVEAVRHSEGSVSANTLVDFLDVFFKEANYGGWRKTLVQTSTGLRSVPFGKSAYTPTQEAERVLHKITGYLMTSRIALPHSTQLINGVLNEGLRNTLAGVWERVTDWPSVRDFVINSGALEEELDRTARQAISGKPSLFEKMFHQPGFHWIRARQVEVMALTGKHEAIEASGRFLSGDTRAELTLKRLGIGTTELKRTGVLDDTMKQQAAYNAAKQSIFFRTPLNTPFRRESGPLGRMAFTYSHYHFNMFRIIKNSLKNSYLEQGIPGVLKWTAKIGIMFPIAGELIQVVENGLYRRDLTKQDMQATGVEPVDAYLNATAHASAFGMIYSINRANKQSMITNTVVGPVAGTGINVATDVTKAIIGQETKFGAKHDWRPVERDVLRHVPVIGPTLSGTLVPYEDKPVAVPRRPSVGRKFVKTGDIF